MIPKYLLRDRRFYLLFPPRLTFDIRQIEGIRWHNDLKTWSVPASWRCVKELESLGFAMGGPETNIYRDWLEGLATKSVSSWATPTYETAGKTLFQFQNQGVTFLGPLDFALLYDEPGVGKTLQALTWAKDDPQVLVVAPKAVIYQWADLIEDMGKPVVVQPKGVLPSDTWAVTNYERLARLTPSKGLTLIVDECHYIKNPKSKRSKLVLEHSNYASRILTVSGTPFINRPIEIFPIMVLLRERKQREFWGFVQRYCGAHQDEWGHWDFSGATHLDELKDEMLHFALRRTKAEVLKDLPPKTYATVRVGLSKEELNEVRTRDTEIFELLGKGYGAYSKESLGAIQRLRLHGANAKVPGTTEVIRNHFESGGGPIVLFSGFKEPLRRIANACGGTLYTGDESDAERNRAKEAFTGGTVKLICLTYGAGGAGLDGLQNSAECVILLDLPWTPAEIQQAEDRVHRQGQTKQVNIISIWSGSKVEQIQLAARDKKLDVISYLQET